MRDFLLLLGILTGVVTAVSRNTAQITSLSSKQDDYTWIFVNKEKNSGFFALAQNMDILNLCFGAILYRTAKPKVKQANGSLERWLAFLGSHQDLSSIRSKRIVSPRVFWVYGDKSTLCLGVAELSAIFNDTNRIPLYKFSHKPRRA